MATKSDSDEAWGCLILFGLLTWLFLSLWSVAGDPPPPPESGKTSFGEGYALWAAEFAVEHYLRSPGSAEFRRRVWTWIAEHNAWRVTGVVDAQNAFGALLRQDYEVVIQDTCPAASEPCVNFVSVRIGEHAFVVEPYADLEPAS